MTLHRTPPLAVACLVLVPLAAGQDAAFDPPVALTADGVTIDVGPDIGHAGPLLRDHDGDGKHDLLVSSFRGTIQVFRNVGTNAAPEYADSGKLQAVGDERTDLRFHNW